MLSSIPVRIAAGDKKPFPCNGFPQRGFAGKGSSRRRGEAEEAASALEAASGQKHKALAASRTQVSMVHSPKQQQGPTECRE